MVTSKRNKNRRDSQKVITDWQHTEQPSPAFKRLMMLLLEPEIETKPGCSVCGETEFWTRADGRRICSRCQPKP